MNMNKPNNKTRKASVPRKVRRSTTKQKVYHVDVNVDGVIQEFQDFLTNYWETTQNYFSLNDLNENVRMTMSSILLVSEHTDDGLIQTLVKSSIDQTFTKYVEISDNDFEGYYIVMIHYAYYILLDYVMEMVTGQYLLNNDGTHFLQKHLFNKKDAA